MKVKAPLFRDPIYDGAADPTMIKNENDGVLYMFYTQRRATQNIVGVSGCYGSRIGVACSEDGGEWYYRGALELEFEFGQNTFWAPEIIYCHSTRKYHMYVSYIRGIRTSWVGKATIEHYTSNDLFTWEHIAGFSFDSDRIIDACVHRLPSGIWRMWYKDECWQSHTCYADSDDLYHWTRKGEAISDCAHEGPNVFMLGGKYYMITDMWKGMGVYSSDDLESFTKQDSLILADAGERPLDGPRGHHADVFTAGGRAYIVYFTHPGVASPGCTAVQLGELKLAGGELICDRSPELEVDLLA